MYVYENAFERSDARRKVGVIQIIVILFYLPLP